MRYYTYSDIAAMVPPSDRWPHKVTITMEEGDMAYAPGTTKKVLKGVGELHYLLHQDGGSDVIHAEGGHFWLAPIPHEVRDAPRAKRKPFLSMPMEDSLKEKLRRYIHDVEYWLERARLESGPDSDRYRTCDTTRIAYTLCLGERIMQCRMGMDSGEKFRSELCPHVALTEGNNYLERARREGTPEKEPGGPVMYYVRISRDDGVHYVDTREPEFKTLALKQQTPVCDRGLAMATVELTTQAVNCIHCLGIVG